MSEVYGVGVRFAHVRLEASRASVPRLVDFYGRTLDLNVEVAGPDRLVFAIGETTMEFVDEIGESFYHFALLVPGNRFDRAIKWAGARTELLPDPDSGEMDFEFENWNASACYFHDPAGNVVELIAHRGLHEASLEGEFEPGELVGLSELGLVGDSPGMAQRLADDMGLQLWDGTLENPERLAFVGEKGRTLILAQPGRGWLPTGRAAEAHPVEALLLGRAECETQLEGGRYRIRSRVAFTDHDRP
jgi:catechol 2,3-dioxygenase-like lactoylglutathione lyase family enzyme